MDKDLHEYTPDEIRRWQQSAYPSASGRTWRKRVRELTYHAVKTTLPAGCTPVVDGIADLLTCVPSVSRLVPWLLVSSFIFVTTPLALAFAPSATGVTYPFDASVIALLTVARSCLGWMLVVGTALAGIGFVMQGK